MVLSSASIFSVTLRVQWLVGLHENNYRRVWPVLVRCLLNVLVIFESVSDLLQCEKYEMKVAKDRTK